MAFLFPKRPDGNSLSPARHSNPKDQNMKLKDIIKSYNWLSIEMTLLKLYPDQIKSIDGYKKVFENLQTMQPVKDEMQIVLTEYESDPGEESMEKSGYIGVSGRKQNNDPDTITDSYALEFVKWENWLGMDISPETIDHFNELEIIAHCLFEMTFCGYEQDEIQEQFNTIKLSIEEYENLSDDEKKEQTISWEELKKEFNQSANR